MKGKAFSSWMMAAVALLILATTQITAIEKKNFLDGEFWRRQALRDIIPYWFDHVRDTNHGGFHLALSRDWRPIPPWEKLPPMISRQVFGFCAAYLLSGNEKYLEVARQGVDYLISHAWDREYGGWFDSLTQDGKPKEMTKTVPVQLYTDVGLTLYYFVTKDERALSHVLQSVEIRKKYGYDKEFGGYFQSLNRDLSVKDASKSKHSHFGYTSSLLINLAMATRNPDALRFAEELMQISLERMTDSEYGWLYGFPTTFGRKWNYTQSLSDGKEIISAGAQLTGSLAFLRLYEFTGNEIYGRRGRELGEKIIRYAWDSMLGGWHDHIERQAPHAMIGPRTVSWWIQCYGDFLQLHLYHITGDRCYLDQFKKMASFWNDNFMDKKLGGVFQTISYDGTPVDVNKAMPWKTSYHEMEHGLLNYLYLNLYVNKKQVKLYFHLRDVEASSKHFVSLTEDPSVHIKAVKVNGKPWSEFDARERSVTLPKAKDLKMEVILEKSAQK